jgi:hypothetical protein
MARPLLDRTGTRYSRLVCILPVGTDVHRLTLWLCLCDCGNHTIVSGRHLTSGDSRSCGCMQREAAFTTGKANTTHGHSRRGKITAEYRAWFHMWARCTNPNVERYPHYGQRGIRVCRRWKRFEKFYADVGPRPSAQHSLDRINNDGHYEPGNVRWATRSEQRRNRPYSRKKTCQSVKQELRRAA